MSDLSSDEYEAASKMAAPTYTRTSPVAQAVALPNITGDEQLRGIENYKEWKITLYINLRALGLKEHLLGCKGDSAPRSGQNSFRADQAATTCYIWNSLSFKVKQALLRSGLWGQAATPAETMDAITQVVLPKDAVPAMLKYFENFDVNPTNGTKETLEEINLVWSLINHHVPKPPNTLLVAAIHRTLESKQPAAAEELQRCVDMGP
ncbi:hypothetical protein JDV02_005078 [Purpureocillium takamizusanense]|uniref:Uncharacterized protein n=1 Tax=Purpureocillium takamizusanense TaxID=2060973 RepID=A0A9Q8QF66_9HYPO|nr:uncharacterized protein JDV02_005078 [Purpureocillium takamizusanense]UNI18833.1 hypothetical protein JDV02_005078 [Purpureocillium takamizusanense]